MRAGTRRPCSSSPSSATSAFPPRQRRSTAATTTSERTTLTLTLTLALTLVLTKTVRVRVGRLQALQDTQAKLSRAQLGMAQLENEIAERERQLALSTANVETLQSDRVRLQRENVAVAFQLQEAQASLASAVRDR